MDAQPPFRYFSAMHPDPIPVWQLYGEHNAFPDVLHVERIIDRAAGLDWTIAPHRHLHLHQVFLLLSGQIRMTLDGAAQPVTPPVIVNIPRGTVHGFAFSAGTEGFVLTLPADDFPDLFGPVAETAAPLSRVFTLPAAPPMISRMQALSAAHAESRPFRQTQLRGEAAALLAMALDSAQQVHPQRAADPRIQRFATLVRATLSSRQTVEDLAAELAMSPRHLSRLCRSQTGLSAQAFVEAHKIREACRLLVYTRMSVQQVAFHLGFDDPSYFSRVFQRNLRLSPTAYRARFDGAAA